MIKKRGQITIFIIVAIILTSQISFISSEEETTTTNIAAVLGLKGELTCEKCGIDKFNKAELALNEGKIRLNMGEGSTFTDPDGNKFEKIGVGKQSFINLDEKGIPVKAAFTTTGGSYCFGGSCTGILPSGTQIRFDKENGITLVPPEGSKLPETSQQSDPRAVKYPITIQCPKECTLPNGHTISGRLHLDKTGQAYVDSTSEKVEINGVELSSIESRTDIFFDGKRYNGNYVSFGKDNLIISSSEGKSPIVNFEEKNPYLQIDKGDYVAMQTLQGSEIEIQNRDPKLIPRVVSKGGFEIQQDSKLLKYEKGLFGTKNIPGLIESTTSPIELIPFNKKGSALFFGDKILVDNFNRFAFFVPEKNLEFTNLQEGIPVKFSTKVRYNYPSEESLGVLTGKKLIFNNVPQGNKDLVLGRLRDYWETLTPETKKAITVIDFSSEEYFDNEVRSKKYSSDAEKTKAVTLNDKTMLFRSTGERFNLELFRHESAHVHHIYLDKIPNEARKKIRLEREGIYRESKRLSNSKKNAKTESELIEINKKLDELQKNLLIYFLRATKFLKQLSFRNGRMLQDFLMKDLLRHMQKNQMT